MVQLLLYYLTLKFTDMQAIYQSINDRNKIKAAFFNCTQKTRNIKSYLHLLKVDNSIDPDKLNAYIVKLKAEVKAMVEEIKPLATIYSEWCETNKINFDKFN
jgi:phage host-nuclease inhibitor protein Gam